MIRYLIVVCLVLGQLELFAQSTHLVKNALGKAYLTDDKTPNQVKEIALNEAKKEALRKAGVSEYISSNDILYSSSDGKKINQIFNSISNVELSGAISKIEHVQYIKQREESTQLDYIEAKIDAEVIKYTKKTDPAFLFEISGIRDSYKADESLNFSIHSLANGYVRIFLLNDSICSQLFPNQFESQNVLKLNTQIQFPTKRGLAYSFDLKNELESDNLIFVFTKKDIPFTKKETMHDIIQWIYSISPDERKVMNYSVVIKK